ncbi:MAG TPA: ABC transporter substrate-binding protein [Burkholderiales bacterium]|nr:ABC transporter substrate-binding protein [Burkholderiales bacterium]
MTRFSLSRIAVVAIFALAPMIAAAQPKGPIKIGGLFEMTGVFSPNATEAQQGMQLYFDEIGNTVAGRKIEVIIEDTAGKPDQGLTKARKLIESDKVHMLVGIVNTGVALAVSSYIREKKVPLIINADAGATALTMPGKFLNPFIVRVSQIGRGPGAAAADWAYKQGWRRVSLIAGDYAGGVEVMGSFARVFCLRGGQIVQEQYAPLGTPDFGPYINNIERKVDGVVAFTPGADGLRFARQYIEAGLKGKIPLMDIYGQATYEPNLTQIGDSALGVLSALHYSSQIKTPENERFVKAFRAKYGHLPSDNGPDGYVGARAIVEAAKASNGAVEDGEKFIAALKGVKFPSPKGDIAIDQYGNVIQSQYIRKVEKVGADYVNTPIATYDSVDQFWPFKSEEYLKFKFYAELKGKLTDCAKCLEKQ